MKYLLLSFLLAVTISCQSQQAGFINYKIPLGILMDSLNINKSDIEIHIDKSEYKLFVMAKGYRIKEYPVVFGRNPMDDKLMQGDNCTPEGTFKVRAKYPHKTWSKFIWFDYPNNDSWTKYNKAKNEGKIPADAQIGGEVGIHGVPEGKDFVIDLKINWTAGCISLKNIDVNELFNYVDIGTKVIITK